MSNAKASLSRSLPLLLREMEVKARKLAGEDRLNFTGISSESSPSGGSGRRDEEPNITTDTSFLKTAGDTMVGAIAFYPTAVTISSGAIDISQDTTSKFSSYVIVSGEGAADDTLDTITGAAFAGQIMYMQFILTNEITLTETGGNLILPGGNNVVANSAKDGRQVLKFIFDVTVNANKWTLVSNSAGGAAGVSFPVDPVIKDFGTTSGTLSCLLDASDTGDGHSFKVTANGNVTLTFDNPPASGTQHEFEVEFVQDGTGSRTLTLPASVVDTVNVSSGAGTTTIITFRTNDGGTTYLALTVRFGSVSGGPFLKLSGGSMTGDITMGNNDLLTAKSVQFQNGGTITAGTSMIVSDASGDMILNVATGDQIFLNINDVRRFQVGTIGGNVDSFAQITSLDSALPLLKFFNDDSTMSAGAEAGRIEFFSNDGGGASMIYADITVDTENVTAANEAGSLHLGVTINGDISTTTFLSLNNSDDDKITPWKNIHMAAGIDIEMVTNDIWLDEVADGTRLSGSSTSLNMHVGGTFIAGAGTVSFDIQPNIALSINDLFIMNATTATGVADGVMWHDSGTGDVLVRSGGAEKNLSDISAGGGANTALSNLASVAVNLSLVGTTDGVENLGTTTLRWGIGFLDRLDIQDDLASNPANSGITSIEADQGGMNLGVAAGTDLFDFFFGGVSELQIKEDGEIQFNTTGRQHKIVAQATSLDIVSENQADEVELWSGSGRTNASVFVGDQESVFATENDVVTKYDITIQQRHTTPAAGRVIGDVSWEAENTSSALTEYATIEGESSVVTAGAEQGRLRFGVQVNSVVGVVGLELIGVSTALRMSFFGATPVVKQNPAVTAAAIHAALQAYGLFV